MGMGTERSTGPDIPAQHCGSCGKSYYGATNFCEACGSALERKSITIMRCGQCGKDETGQYCRWCGGKIVTIHSQVASEEREKWHVTLRWEAPHCYFCREPAPPSLDPSWYCGHCGLRGWQQRARYLRCLQCGFKADYDPLRRFHSHCGGRFAESSQLREFRANALPDELWLEERSIAQ